MVFDPLDGSSNIDAGISVGSIFGIYAPSEECSVQDMENPEKMMENCVINVCQPGSSLLAAGYCLYSSSTVLVLTVGKGTYGFTFDNLVGEFIMSHRDLKVGPASGLSVYSASCTPCSWWLLLLLKPCQEASHILNGQSCRPLLA